MKGVGKPEAGGETGAGRGRRWAVSLPCQGALSQRVGTRRRAIDLKPSKPSIEAIEGSSGAFTGENLPFVTEPRETNAVAFPRWVEEPPHPLLG